VADARRRQAARRSTQEIPEDTCGQLAAHLAQVRRTFLTVIQTLEGQALSDGPVGTVQHQLKWAAAHVQAAVLALSSKLGATPNGRPPASHDEHDTSLSDELDFSQGLHGHTESITIAEILGFIAGLRKSGTLVVHGTNQDFLIDLKDGKVIYAQGNNPPPGLRVGEVLVAQGALSQTELDEFVEENADAEEVLGTALLQAGRISREALRIALSFQVQHLFHCLTTEQDAYFQFEEGLHRVSSEDILLNVEMLLLESARTQDERDADQAA